MIACPCQNESEINEQWKKPRYINLCKNHIDTYENFQRWWLNNISMVTCTTSLYCNEVRINHGEYLESVYSELVPKLLCNPKIQDSSTSGKVLTHKRDFMHIIDRKTIQEVLLNQSSKNADHKPHWKSKKESRKLRKLNQKPKKLNQKSKRLNLNLQYPHH